MRWPAAPALVVGLHTQQRLHTLLQVVELFDAGAVLAVVVVKELAAKAPCAELGDDEVRAARLPLQRRARREQGRRQIQRQLGLGAFGAERLP